MTRALRIAGASLLATIVLSHSACMRRPPTGPMPTIRDAEEVALPFPGSRTATLDADLAVLRSGIGAMWIEPRGVDRGAVLFSSFDGTRWADAVTVAPEILLDARLQGVVRLVSHGDGSLRGLWFDKRNRARATARVFESRDAGATWQSVAEFGPTFGVAPGSLAWADLGGERHGAAWVERTRGLLGEEVDTVKVGVPGEAAGGDVRTATLAKRASRASGVSVAAYGDEMFVAYREHGPVGSVRESRTSIRVDLVSGPRRGRALSDDDSWVVPAAATGIGPLLAPAEKDLAVVYFSAKRDGYPSVSVWRLPAGGRQEIPTRGHLRDLHARHDPDGALVIAGVEGGYPTIRRVDPSGGTVIRAGRAAIDPQTRLAWEGEFRGTHYLLYATAKGYALSRVLDRHPQEAPDVVAACEKARATLREAADGLRGCEARGESCERETALLRVARRAAGECVEQERDPNPDRPVVQQRESSERWFEASTDHLRVVSNTDEGRTRELASRFERLRGTLRASMAGIDGAEPGLPVTIYAVKTSADFLAFVPDAATEAKPLPVAVAIDGRFGAALVVRASAMDDSGEEELVRRRFHQLHLDRVWPSAPHWLREGLAGVWASASGEGDSLTVGRVDRRTLELVRGAPPVPVLELMRTRRSAGSAPIAAGPSFEAVSMMLVHYLLLGEPEGEAKLRRFATLLAGGHPETSAIVETWGAPDGLQRRFEEYVGGNAAFPARRVPSGEFSARSGSIAVREVAASRIAADRALLLAGRGFVDEAARATEEALRFDRDDAGGSEAKGVMALLAGDLPRAHVWFRRAATRPDARFSAHYLAAMTAPRREDGRPRDRRYVAGQLARCLELEPRFAPAMAETAILMARRDAAAAIELARRATALEPADPRLVLKAALVYRTADHTEAATMLAERAVTRTLAIPDLDLNVMICVRGTAEGFAGIAAPACDNAISLAPSDWRAHDARAAARMLRGDHKGAIDDLRFLLDLATGGPTGADRRTRQAWLDALLRNREGPEAWTQVADVLALDW